MKEKRLIGRLQNAIARHPVLTAVGIAALAAGVKGAQKFLSVQSEKKRRFIETQPGRFQKRRRHYVYEPSNLSRNAVESRRRPLMVVLHGCAQSAVKIAQATRFNQFAERDNFIVLYPAQRWIRHIQNCWKWYKLENQKRGSGELAEIMAMIREAQAQYPIDPKQIYVVGLSSGGGIAAALLACYPEFFAGGLLHSAPAYASAQGLLEGMRVQHRGPHAKKKATPPVADPSLFKGDLLVVQGTVDKTLHPSHAERLVEQFLPAGERALRETVTVTNPNARGLGGRLILYGPRAEERGRSRVAKLEIDGLGHAWSGGDESVQFSEPHGPDVTAAAVNFLIEKKLPFSLRAGEAIAPSQVWVPGLRPSLI